MWEDESPFQGLKQHAGQFQAKLHMVLDFIDILAEKTAGHWLK